MKARKEEVLATQIRGVTKGEHGKERPRHYRKPEKLVSKSKHPREGGEMGQ